MNTQPHMIPAEDPETGVITADLLAYVHPASDDAVRLVMNAEEGGLDGRSEFVWLRLSNGDLILGVFPKGDTYFAVEDDAAYPASA